MAMRCSPAFPQVLVFAGPATRSAPIRARSVRRSGNFLRASVAGFLTSAAESGADALKMAEVSRHRSLDEVRGYVRRSNWVSLIQRASLPSPAVARLPGLRGKQRPQSDKQLCGSMRCR